MKLTEEQKAVVDLHSGSHLVLAPPGSGKTEMLSQRILKALTDGVDPRRMLCATFTNRAAFEMRSRVTADAEDKALPDVGNLHHFCLRFLCSVGRLYPGKHVLDEVQQCDFVKEITNVLIHELKTGSAAEPGKTHGVTVIGLLGQPNEARRQHLLELLEKILADARKREANPFAELLGGVLIVHQCRRGIPVQFRRPLPSALYALNAEGVLYALDRAYCGLKRKFRSVDFDDLVIDTFLWLEAHDLAEERKFLWVQVDEVQDLSPLQWRIIERVTAHAAVSVYFGDLEQAIFSFLGASIQVLMDATRHCERHYFKTNFRATPQLLEILMRFSIASMKSDWEFLPHPVDRGRDMGDLAIFKSSRAEDVLRSTRHLLDSVRADTVALLVRTNAEADAYEDLIKPLGCRYAKVSGQDLFTFEPMRDFLAFLSLLSGAPTMNDWECLFRRFGHRHRSSTEVRYFVRAMYAAGYDPCNLLREDKPRPWRLFLSSGDRTAVWQWKHRRDLNALSNAIREPHLRLLKRLDGQLTFRGVFYDFARIALQDEAHYAHLGVSVAHIRERLEKYLRYTDHLYANDRRTFRQILHEDWDQLSKLKEADLLVGDERIVISTIHKAKGRQFDAVIIPSAADVLNPAGAVDPDDPLRLLYVAMSRAKRHLHIFGDRPCAEIDPIRACFKARYRCYYTTGPAADDWLTKWEFLSGFLQQKRIPLTGEPLFNPKEPPVLQRIRLKLLRFHDDAAAVARICTTLLDRGIAAADIAIRTLAATRQFSNEVFTSLRAAVLRDRSPELVHAASDYYRKLAMSLRADALSGLEDFLYFSSGQIRLTAAADLAALGSSRWMGIITGGIQDFERLAQIAAPEHEFPIRAILATNPPSAYATRLRDILFKRALR